MTERKSGPAFAKAEGSAIEAVMSRDKAKASSYAQRHNIKKWYTDAMDVIDDPNVDAIYIATPPSSHATYAVMAMKAGKPVYIEKPMAQSYDECMRINRVSRETGVPCFVAYYRRYLPYFLKVKELIPQIGKLINVQIRFAQPPKELDYNSTNLPWRVIPDISGGGYFYDLAPHQIDMVQELCGCIIDAYGLCSNRAGLYQAEDTVSACFKFENGLVGSGSWCFVADESALHDSEGRHEFDIPNPEHVQFPLVQAVVDHLNGKGVCTCDGISATPTNWVMDRILGKF